MKRTLICLLLSLIFNMIYAQNDSIEDKGTRKKVALVLSGGGARGTAHIGVLKVIEKAGIPIDIIVGTSMGSLVGGLYSIGYTANELDSIVTVQNWKSLLTDIGAKKEEEPTIGEITKNTKDNIKLGGLVKGVNILNLLTQLTSEYSGNIDFNKLPIKFACVATDLSKFEEYVFHKGPLPTAMRASMSIPAFFSPVFYNDKILVDGGLRNNFPADIAKEMGADIIIGVSVQNAEQPSASDFKSVTGIVNGIINSICKNKYEENWQLTDIGIRVDLEEYKTTSFSKKAIRSMVESGEQAAYEHWEELLKLKESIK